MHEEEALPISDNASAAIPVSEIGAPTSRLFCPKDLVDEQILDIRLAAERMSGSQRRDFMAEMSLKYCMGNARLTESVFKWSRNAVATGLGEKRCGMLCIGLQSTNCGNDRWEGRHPEIAGLLCNIAESQSQQDPTFESPMAYTRLTGPSALNALKEAGMSDDKLPSRSSMVSILNRLGYRLRKVVKAKPLKKIEKTDAIFENIKKKITKPRIQKNR